MQALWLPGRSMFLRPGVPDAMAGKTLRHEIALREHVAIVADRIYCEGR